MNVQKTALISIGLAIACNGNAFAQKSAIQNMSAAAACDRLKDTLSKLLRPEHGAAEYHCDEPITDLIPAYYVFGLRSNYPAPKRANSQWVGSALVGWYAVHIADGKIREWDVANLKLGNPIN